jgi:lysyl-tRNA synthetase class II
MTISCGMPNCANVSRSNARGSTERSPKQVQLHIDERARKVFNSLEALIESLCPVDLRDQRIRNRFASLVVNGEPLQNLGCRQPVFQQLRWEL